MTGDTDQENAKDVSLMCEVAAGSHEAFAALVERHQHAVIGTIARMTNRSPDTEDLAQQVFLRLWKSASRYKPTAKFTTYLFTITRNLVFNHTKKITTRREDSLDSREGDWHQQTADSRPHQQPDQSLHQKEIQRAVDQAIANLPKQQRLAVVLRRYEDMPYEDIAKILGLTVSAVKSQLFRARTQLRDELERFLDGA